MKCNYQAALSLRRQCENKYCQDKYKNTAR